MRQFSTGDLVRKVGDVTHAASQAPVAITQHRKPRFVMMSVEAYQALHERPKDPRLSIRTSETPKEIADWLLPELEKLAKGEGGYDDDGSPNPP